MNTRLKTMARASVPVLCGWIAATSQAFAGNTDLHNDVFARPTLVAAEPAQAAASEAGSWRPALRAIVQAGDRSMVLVDRSVVELGGSIDGYRLVGVDHDKAVFAKGRRRVELTLGRVKGDAR